MSDEPTLLKQLMLDMFAANVKAEKASFEYNKLDEEMAAVERASGYARGYADSIVDQRVRDRKDKDLELKTLFNRYNFWAGEVQRYKAVVQTIIAFETYQLNRPKSNPLPPLYR